MSGCESLGDVMSPVDERRITTLAHGILSRLELYYGGELTRREIGDMAVGLATQRAHLEHAVDTGFVDGIDTQLRAGDYRVDFLY